MSFDFWICSFDLIKDYLGSIEWLETTIEGLMKDSSESRLINYWEYFLGRLSVTFWADIRLIALRVGLWE